MENRIFARIASNGNIKLGQSMGTFSKLYSNKFFETLFGKVQGTCGNHCEGCEGPCYVGKSYRYPSVVNGHARNTLAFRNDLNGSFEAIDKQLSRKRKPFKDVRINQSGEIESTTELLFWIVTARKHPETKFFLYTKNYEAVREIANSKVVVPSNFTCNISIWHEQGIAEYNEFKHLSWIRAFAYDDGYDYKAHGLEIETYCKAYDKSGKLDHKVTCDVCRKCIDRDVKVTGCYEH